MQWCFLLLTDHRTETDTFAVLQKIAALPHYNYNKRMVEGFTEAPSRHRRPNLFITQLDICLFFFLSFI